MGFQHFPQFRFAAVERCSRPQPENRIEEEEILLQAKITNLLSEIPLDRVSETTAQRPLPLLLLPVAPWLTPRKVREQKKGSLEAQQAGDPIIQIYK